MASAIKEFLSDLAPELKIISYDLAKAKASVPPRNLVAEDRIDAEIVLKRIDELIDYIERSFDQNRARSMVEWVKLTKEVQPELFDDNGTYMRDGSFANKDKFATVDAVNITPASLIDERLVDRSVVKNVPFIDSPDGILHSAQ